MKIIKLQECIQSANINFLFGSGLSRPYLSTLGDIEKWLTELSNISNTIPNNLKEIIKASIYKEYFTTVILPNRKEEKDKKGEYITVLSSYKELLSIWNDIINRRSNRLLSKQINIYTTNIDTFIEESIEDTKVEFNDGFKGSINPIFDESNFQKSYNKTSIHYKNTSEIPVFNLLKMHGSINWNESSDNKISNDYNLELVKHINEELQKIDINFFIECNDWSQILTDAQNKAEEYKSFKLSTKYKTFLDLYENLIIVNPTKRKFSETVMDIHFYELMRMYSNSLEKESSILFVMGFSFADEHIAKITLRAAKTNPTLLIVIFAYSDDNESEYKEKLFLNNEVINNNIIILTPKKFKDSNEIDDMDKKKKDIINSVEKFDLHTINNIFKIIATEIPVNYNYGK
jgi:hypothetical protein